MGCRCKRMVRRGIGRSGRSRIRRRKGERIPHIRIKRALPKILAKLGDVFPKTRLLLGPQDGIDLLQGMPVQRLDLGLDLLLELFSLGDIFHEAGMNLLLLLGIEV